MASFNLVHEAWIPCRAPDGQVEELSLRNTLVRAHELSELWDPSPLVTVGLHRLLLAILHRCFGPEDQEAWKALWTDEKFDAARLDTYLQEHRDRFDLFHPVRPFCQVPRMHKLRSPGVEVELHPVQTLAQEAASGNNATLFDHNRKDRPRPMSPAEAARYLLARQAYSIALGVSEPFPFKDAPLIRGYTVMAQGKTLFETLMLNLLPLKPRPPIPHRCERDLPAWEYTVSHRPDPAGTEPCGYLDYLTFLSRRIHLVPDADGLVRHCQVNQNLFVPKGLQLFDPFKAYRRDERAGWMPRGFQREKAVWRDSEALFEDARNRPEAAGKRPEVFEHLAWIDEQRREGKIAAQPSYSINVGGLATDPGKATSVIFWRHERLPLPLAYLNDEKLRGQLHLGLQVGEDAGRVLERAVHRYATLMCIPIWDRLSEAERRQATGQTQTRRQINQLAAALRPGLWYWPRLEAAFRELLVRLPEERQETSGDVSYDGRALTTWARQVQRAAREAFAASTRGTDATPRSLKAAAMAGEVFRLGLGRVVRGFNLQEDEEAA